MASSSSPVLKTYAVIGSSFLAGIIASFSWITMPTVERAPDSIMADQWRKAYRIGAALMPPQAAGYACLWGYLAWKSPSGSNSRMQYTLAALMIPSIIPFTLTIQKPINSTLTKRAEDLAGPPGERRTAAQMIYDEGFERVEGERTAQLIRKWNWYNLARAGMVFVGTVIGAWPDAL